MLFHIRSKTETHGAILLLKCPRCSDTDLFDLCSVKSTLFILVSIPIISNGKSWYLKCRHCPHDIVLKGQDIEKALQLNRSILDYEAGTISKEELLNIKNTVRLQCIEEIEVSQAAINCPACGKDVPGSFMTCWNCGAEVAGNDKFHKGKIDVLEEDDNHSSSPFGNMKL